MANQGINIGGIYADLDIRTGNLDRGLANARKALEAIDSEVKKLDADFNSGAITLSDYTARTAALGNTTRELTTRMEAAYGATRSLHTGLEIFNQGLAAGAKSANQFGYAMMQVGSIIDDVQYGFTGVVNNIAPLVYGLSGSMGLASAVQIVTVGVFQLYKHWDDFNDLIGTGRVRTEAEEMEKLAKATKLTADEQARLNKYKEEQKNIDSIKDLKSKEDRETKQAVFDVFAEEGPDKVIGALASQMNPGISPEQQARLDEIEAGRQKPGDGFGDRVNKLTGGKSVRDGIVAEINKQVDADLAKARQEIAKENADEARRRAEKLVGQAAMGGQEGQRARDVIAGRFGDPSHPLFGFANKLKGTSPEARAADKRAEEEARQREIDQRNEERAKREAEQAQAAKDRERSREVGRRRFLEELHEQGRATPGDTGELLRMTEQDEEANKREREKDAREAKQKQDEIDRNREKEIGRLAFLKEESDKRFLKPHEAAEMGRLQQAADDKAERDRESANREAMQTGLELAPGGIKEIAQVLATQERTGAIGVGETFEQIRTMLKNRGATDEQADFASDKLTEDAKKDLDEGIAKRLFGEREQQEFRTSQVFNANDLAAQFQSSVGGNNEAKKQTTLLEKLEKNLDQLVRAGVVPFRIE